MSTHQEYWDACLIKNWRTFGTLNDAFTMFESITGVNRKDADLLRFPNMGLPWKMQVRVFTDNFLPKIHARLLEQEPVQDVLLLKKLSGSKYTVLKQKLPEQKELENERKSTYSNRKKIGMSKLEFLNRNNNTNWNIVKGGGGAKVKR